MTMFSDHWTDVPSTARAPARPIPPIPHPTGVARFFPVTAGGGADSR